MLSEIELEFAQLNHRWKLLCDLFVDDSTVDLMNKSGSHVFTLFQKLVIDDVILSLCRLSDPPRSCGKENNSLKYHFGKKRNHMAPEVVVETEDLFSKLDKEMSNIRDTRNWAMSHSDLEIATKLKDLPNITYDEIESIIELACKILNRIFETRGKYVPTSRGTSATTLLKVLSRGLEINRL